MAPAREISCSYTDPLEIVWLSTAERLGMNVERSTEVYAEWDGLGTLRIADAGSMDPDDCVAQLVFHEICHALIEGPDAWEKPDWGLVNRDDRHLGREQACHRLQAALAAAHGLRQFLAVTTDHRPYYDALPADPISGHDPAAAAARPGWLRATEGPWAGPLDDALHTTALLARALRGFTADGSLWSRAETAAKRG